MVAAAVRRPAGLTATLEVRTSSGLAVRDTYGAVVPLFAAGRPTEQWEALTGRQRQERVGACGLLWLQWLLLIPDIGRCAVLVVLPKQEARAVRLAAL